MLLLLSVVVVDVDELVSAALRMEATVVDATLRMDDEDDDSSDKMAALAAAAAAVAVAAAASAAAATVALLS